MLLAERQKMLAMQKQFAHTQGELEGEIERLKAVLGHECKLGVSSTRALSKVHAREPHHERAEEETERV
eukprot:5835738-Alexandrium_andersonii.AAC.1